MSGHQQKATEAQLIESYQRTRSVWKVAKVFGMCGQTVHERLARLGVIVPQRELTDEERSQIRALYERGFRRGDGALKTLAQNLGRTVQLVCRTAKEMGLTAPQRPCTMEHSAAQGARVKAHFDTHGHPRGFAGKRHTESTKERIGAFFRGREVPPEVIARALQTKVARYGTVAPRCVSGPWKAGWREVGGKRFYARSRWEANYGRYLQLLKDCGCIREWDHEPKTFWFEGIRRGVCSYLPDFLVIENDGREVYHEVKGHMDARSRTKLARMARYFPAVEMRVLDGDWFKANARKLSRIVPGWEMPGSTPDDKRSAA